MELSFKGELTVAVHQKQLERLKNKILLTSYRLILTLFHNPTAPTKFSTYMPRDNNDDHFIIVHVILNYQA